MNRDSNESLFFVLINTKYTIIKIIFIYSKKLINWLNGIFR